MLGEKRKSIKKKTVLIEFRFSKLDGKKNDEFHRLLELIS